MYNPEGSDNNKEFIEIYSDDYTNLTDFIIEDISIDDYDFHQIIAALLKEKYILHFLHTRSAYLCMIKKMI